MSVARSNIFIIGNGFDLAHGLKTSYKDFISYYCKRLKEDNKCLPELIQPEITLEFDSNGIIDPTCFRNLYHDKCKGNLIFMRIIEEIHMNNWCDVEQLYYDMLISTLNKKSHSYTINLINNDFEIIKTKLEEYLITEYKRIEKLESYSYLFNSFHLGDRLIINFNYTNSFELYVNKENSLIYNIHGQISDDLNPIIFGYAANYEKIKKFLSQNNKEYLRNIKSFNYKRTDIEFLIEDFLTKNEYSQYNIFILGHSCGISDENILHKLLGSEHVANIVPFYFNGYDQYNELVINISRILKDENKSKKIMPFNKCPRMIQYNENGETDITFINKIENIRESIEFKE